MHEPKHLSQNLALSSGFSLNRFFCVFSSSSRKRCYFVDLFVRVSNKIAIEMYTKLGYIVYRTVLEYYVGDPDEDAYDMRKACSRDVHKKSVIPLEHPVRPEEVD